MRKTHLVVLAVVAVAIVLAIGAVSAYADLASDTQAPATTTDAGTSYWNSAAITATTTDNEGIAFIYHELDEGVVRLATVTGKPLTATVAIPTDKDSPLAAGEHQLKYWAQDINGNVEAQHSLTFTVAKDVAAPVTSATGATDGGWYKASLDIDLAAADGASESGVKQLSYALGASAPTVVAAAAADVTVAIDGTTANGPLALTYQATDVAGNVEAVKTLTVNVDTMKPKTSASAASVVKGRTAKLKYKATDAAPNGGKATVVIKVKRRSGKVVKTIKAGSVAVNKSLSTKFKCTLAKGKYKFYVYATDMAGNAQSRIGSNKLTVK